MKAVVQCIKAPKNPIYSDGVELKLEEGKKYEMPVGVATLLERAYPSHLKIESFKDEPAVKIGTKFVTIIPEKDLKGPGNDPWFVGGVPYFIKAGEKGEVQEVHLSALRKVFQFKIVKGGKEPESELSEPGNHEPEDRLAAAKKAAKKIKPE